MTVYVLQDEGYDCQDVRGVFPTLEAACEHAKLDWVGQTVRWQAPEPWPGLDGRWHLSGHLVQGRTLLGQAQIQGYLITAHEIDL